MKADQPAAAKHRLRLLGRPCDQLLHQHFAGEGVAGVEIMQRAFQILFVAHKPDAAARGAHRRLDDGRNVNRAAQRLRRCHDFRRRLRQIQLQQQPAEPGLAVRRAIGFETRQRQPDATLESLLHPREQKSLLMRRQQHVELLRRQQLLDKGQEPGRVGPQTRTAMKFSDETRIPCEAPGRGIADLDVMTQQAQNRDRFPRRSAGTLGHEHAERFCGIDHAGSLPHRPRLSLILMTHFLDQARFAGAAMQRHSWTNNR